MSFEEVADRVAAAFEVCRRRPVQALRVSRPTRVEALSLVTMAARPRLVRAASSTVAGTYRLDLDGEIGLWGITAADFVAQLEAVPVGMTVELHINSPGGDVFDGIAIMNALADHPARVEVVVDALAASAASFIAMAGDTVKMNRASLFMIHDAMTVTGGNEADHLRSAELLGKVSDTIAGLYAAKAGGTPEEWRDLMRAETWFTPEQAVERGLADEAVDEEPAEPTARVDGVFLAKLRNQLGALS